MSLSASKPVREELAGKRFLCVLSGGKTPKLSQINNWNWRGGIIRCATHLDSKDPDFQILVEFDDQDWTEREWWPNITSKFHLLLIECNLVLVSRSSATGSLHPALTFKPLVDNLGLWKSKQPRPVEFLVDLKLAFTDYLKLKVIREWDPTIPGLNVSDPRTEEQVRNWSVQQDKQQILVTTPSVVLGERLKVYRAEGTTQWYTAVTSKYRDDTGEYVMTDDTVLEEHLEDPRLTQMILIGDGVVNSMSKGQDSGAARRASFRASTQGTSKTTPNYTVDTSSSSPESPQKRVGRRTAAKPETPLRRRKSSTGSVDVPSPTKKKKISGIRSGSVVAAKKIAGRRRSSSAPLALRKAAKLQKKKIKPEKLRTPPKKSPRKPRQPSVSSKEEDDEPPPLIVKPKSLPDKPKEAKVVKKKAIAIVRPQPQQEKTEPSTSERKPKPDDISARFALYDFPSDSESEEKSSVKAAKSLTPSKLPTKKFFSNNGNNSGEKFYSAGLISKLRKGRSPSSSKSTPPQTVKKTPCKESERPKVDQVKSEPSQPDGSTDPPKPVKEDKPKDVDKPCPPAPSADSEHPDERSDSGVSTLRGSSECGDRGSRSGSRSSAISDEQRSRPTSASETSVSRALSPPAPKKQLFFDPRKTMSDPRLPSGLPHPPPPGSSPHAAAFAQYQAAALHSLLGAASGPAPSVAHPHSTMSPHLLAQYQSLLASSAAAGVSPDVLLKQYPHLAAGLPPHLLGGARPPHATDPMILARERELAEQRDRVLRERREAEQRERERLEKERAEKERLERDRREREDRERRELQQRHERIERERREQLQREHQMMSVDAAVEQHFQLSMELAKKLPTYGRMLYQQKMGGGSPHWSQLPGMKNPSNDEERRRTEEQARQYMSVMQAAARGAPPPAHGKPGTNTVTTQAYTIQKLKQAEALKHAEAAAMAAVARGQYPQGGGPLGFKPYESMYPSRVPASSPHGRGGPSPHQATPSPHHALASPPERGYPKPTHGYPPPQHRRSPAPAPHYKPVMPPKPALQSPPPSGPPPPAHGGSARPSSANPHLDHRYLPPQRPGSVPHQQTSSDLIASPAPAPPPRAVSASASTAPSSSSTVDDMMPLDLGSKRKPDSDTVPNIPKKTIRLEHQQQQQNAGVLYTVSEPSVLSSTEPSTITTVVNAAVSDMKKEDKKDDEPVHYVHKLKKAWINSYKPDDKGDNSCSNPPTPSVTARGTPSPAPSNKSSSSSKGGRGQRSKAGTPTQNGHGVSSPKLKRPPPDQFDEESTSEDSSSSRSMPKKRGRGAKAGPRSKTVAKPVRGRKKHTSESMSDSEKDSDKEDSDSTTSTSTRRSATSKPEAKRRGRKPLNRKTEDLKKTSSTKKDVRPVNPFQKPPVSQLKRTGESFLQDASCFEVAPKLAKCRECRWTQSQRNKKMPNIFCRFYAFRRLRYTKNGQLAVAGFCDPKRDASEEDLAVWACSADSAPADLSSEQATYLLERLSTDFDLILKQEQEAVESSAAEDDIVAWKRVVQGVREMCDVCEATLFNFHWACSKCGFVVCVDCYVGRKNDVITRSWGENEKDRDKYSWLLCTNRQQHELDKLMLTQIIAGNALEELSSKLLTRKTNGETNGVNGLVDKPGVNGIKTEDDQMRNIKMSDIIDRTVEDSMDDSKTDTKENHVELKFYIRPEKSRVPKTSGFPVQTYNHCDSKLLYPNVSHSWHCDGKVLRLEDDDVDDASKLFKEVWRRGQPVIVSNAASRLDEALWSPDSLSKEFGDTKVEVANQANGTCSGTFPLRKFLDGFTHLSKRPTKDSIVRLKDWPPIGEEFAEALPRHSADVFKSLPLSEYTNRHSVMNLAASLPDVFVRPDLGPRSWMAYGSTHLHHKGTVNLHMDLADSVNIAAHSEVPKDSNADDNIREVLRLMDEWNCDATSKARVRDEREIPTGIWHVFQAGDADNIRDLLNKEENERGNKLETNYDLIHEETKYLDGKLLQKLHNEYGVVPFTIVQFPGDALLVPAGAPKQVKHISNSISVLADFVSPEHLSRCFTLMRQLRYLPESQQMSEDKLQVKNIIYHSLKNALAILDCSAAKIVKKEEEEEANSSDK